MLQPAGTPDAGLSDVILVENWFSEIRGRIRP
jgi:hypothetical protein